VKEMIAAILREHFTAEGTLATEGNLNNDIGVPLTLLRLRAAHRAGVVELGMNHPGETAQLAAMAQPTIGLVNNAQREHQEFMKSVEDVAHEHADLLRALPRGATAVLNADDAYVDMWRNVARERGVQVRDFAIDAPAAVRGRCTLNALSSDVELSTPEGQCRFTLQLPGAHNARNAIAAAAAATAAGASLDAAARGLAGFSAVKGRQQRRVSRGGAVIIDDTYNANPESVRAAIDVLRGFAQPTVLVLGDMGEVGTQGEAFHAEVGAYAREAGVTRLVALGELARHAVEAFGHQGTHAASVEEIVAALSP
jgi:UDP-N-acetylmuramoyl-tripeptide--D-alanyl-D-alanine ligase